MRLPRFMSVVVVLAHVAMMYLPAVSHAQNPIWSQPVNLSRSGSASAPYLVQDAEGTMYAYWWDSFDGLTMSRRDGEGWAGPLRAAVTDLMLDEAGEAVAARQGEAPARTVVKQPGTLAGDGFGGLNVFYPASTTTQGAPPLRHARSSVGTANWSTPITLFSSVSAWRSVEAEGVVHLVVFYTGRSGERVPGVYHVRSSDGGATWGTPVLVVESLYVRSADQATSHIEIAVGTEGRVYLTWNEPGAARALWSWSRDNGASWTQPQPVNSDDLSATNATIATSGNGHVLMLWQSSAAGSSPIIHASESPDGGYNWTEPHAVLSALQQSQAGLTLAGAADLGLALVVGGLSGGPGVALWPASASSTAAQAGLSDLVTPGYPTRSAEGVAAAGVARWQAVAAGETMVLVGVDQNREVWAIDVALDDIAWNYSGGIWTDTGMDGYLAQGVRLLGDAGAISAPLVIPAANDGRQVFWWDEAQGLMSAFSDGSVWYRPQAAQIFAVGAGAAASIPLYNAQLAGNGWGNVDALWMARGALGAGGASKLLSSSLVLGQHVWSAPASVADSVVAWQAYRSADGRWHVLFGRTAVAPAEGKADPASAGVYYAQLAIDGSGWRTPVRVASVDTVAGMTNRDLAVTAVGDRVYACWGVAAAQGVVCSTSTDVGETWRETAPVSGDVSDAQLPLVAGLDDGALVLFQSRAQEQSGTLYAANLSALGQLRGTAEALDLTVDGDAEALRLLGWDGSGLLLGQQTGGTLAIARWTAQEPGGGGWSRMQQVPVWGATGDTPFDPVQLHATLIGDTLALGVRGVAGQAGITRVQQYDGRWEQVNASGWSGFHRIAELSPEANVPVIQVDAHDRVHALWSVTTEGDPALWYTLYSEGTWTDPAVVIQAAQGAASPSLVSMGERVHVAWSGSSGRVDTAGAFAAEAYGLASWAEEDPLPGPGGAREALAAQPALYVDLAGTLHAVYAVPINQDRGVYYTRYSDDGTGWTEAQRVFDAAAAGWTLVDEPCLAVDHDGTLFVAWLRMDLVGVPQARALYLARSRDSGQTWSEPRLVAEGDFAAPSLVMASSGQPHLLWQEAGAEHGVWHSWSADRGDTWSLPMRVRGFSSIAGTAGVAGDGQGAVYLAGIDASQEDTASLVLGAWDAAAEAWALEAPQPLPLSLQTATDLVLGLAPLTGRLHALVTADIVTVDGTVNALLHSVRQVAARPALPEWTGGAQVLVSEGPSPTAPATASERATLAVDVDDLPAQDGLMTTGPMTVPILAMGGLLMVGLLVAAVMAARGRFRR